MSNILLNFSFILFLFSSAINAASLDGSAGANWPHFRRFAGRLALQ